MGMFSSDPRPVISCDPELGAKQSFKDECDINKILKRHREGAMLTHVNANPGVFADVTGFRDYRDVLERVERASVYFAGLSAEVRGRFENEPGNFLDFVADPSNLEELQAMGLGPAVEEAEPPVVAPAPPVVAPAPPVEPVVPVPPAEPVVEG